jgi:hypothetical protein
MRKPALVVGLVVLLLLIIGAELVILFRSSKYVITPGFILQKSGITPPLCKVLSEEEFSGTVSAWIPDKGSLLVNLDSGCRAYLYIEVPMVNVIIPINAPGQAAEETIVMTKRNPMWQNAYCPGDRVDVISKIWTNKQLPGETPVAVNSVRNRGPRSCVR